MGKKTALGQELIQGLKEIKSGKKLKTTLVSTATVHFDPEVKAAYVKIKKGRVKKTEDHQMVVILDKDKKGKVLGIEILGIEL